MQRLLNTQGKLLGIDFGDKRTGLAVCDKNRIIASGIGQISVGGMQRTAAHICGLIKQEGITGGIVVGLPINMDGSHGPRAEHAEKFARILGEMLAEDEITAKLPIVMLDERMTTMAASRFLNETDTRGKKRKGVIDTLSAGPEVSLVVEKLEEYIEAGMDYEEICDKITHYLKKTGLIFMLKSLKTFANNGRVSPIVAKIVGIAGICIVGKASDEGTLEPMHKCRGEKRSLETLLEELELRGFKDGKISIGHCQNESAALALKEMIIKKFNSAKIEIHKLKGLCSFYAEKGGVLVGFEMA